LCFCRGLCTVRHLHSFPTRRSSDLKVLIMDEPTANLSPNASQRLLELVRDLRGQGVSIIIISHRMQEIFDVGDRISVLRQGEMVGTLSIADATEDDVLNLIVAGRRSRQEGG